MMFVPERDKVCEFASCNEIMFVSCKLSIFRYSCVCANDTRLAGGSHPGMVKSSSKSRRTAVWCGHVQGRGVAPCDNDWRWRNGLCAGWWHYRWRCDATGEGGCCSGTTIGCLRETTHDGQNQSPSGSSGRGGTRAQSVLLSHVKHETMRYL